ncbi:MAG: Crp/Fnr family transcriptional regulator [Ectothiorhodospiraceae bacterium]|nr:Crp/Fnr family transcriptional regulator [Chromatiales bacterium]MCP5153758.1 Crp/Fnr family transcriptional regulator [Ectothiorhodospiraceae bacterium]
MSARLEVGGRQQLDTRQSPQTRVERTLEATTLLAGCPRQDIEAVARVTAPRAFSGKQTIVRRGEACDALYVVEQGAVKLLRQHDGRPEKVLELLGPNAVFGETALLCGRGYPYRAIALEDSHLLAIEAAPLLALIQERPMLAWRLIAHLAEAYESALDTIEIVGTFSAEQRVAAYLLTQRARVGEATWFQGPRSRRDLASLLCITPETLSRTISEFRRKGWVETEGRRIGVLEPEALDALLGG